MTHEYQIRISPGEYLFWDLPKNPQEFKSVVDFPPRVFHCFSRCSYVCTCLPLGMCAGIPVFRCGVLRGSTQTAEWCFHTAPRHLLQKGTPLNGIHLLIEEVAHPLWFYWVWGRGGESTFWGFLTSNRSDGRLFFYIIQSQDNLFRWLHVRKQLQVMIQ